MDKRQKDLSNYRITEANDSLKVDDHCLKEGLYRDSINQMCIRDRNRLKQLFSKKTGLCETER